MDHCGFVVVVVVVAAAGSFQDVVGWPSEHLVVLDLDFDWHPMKWFWYFVWPIPPVPPVRKFS